MIVEPFCWSDPLPTARTIAWSLYHVAALVWAMLRKRL